jgi:hypothetical protein
MNDVTVWVLFLLGSYGLCVRFQKKTTGLPGTASKANERGSTPVEATVWSRTAR